MIKELVSLANKLDNLGLYKEADIIDQHLIRFLKKAIDNDVIICDNETLERQKQIVVEAAKYHGRTVPLNKPMRGDVKKFKVYVKDPTTKNVKKVNFGDPDMKIKKNIPERRKSFRARHNCDNPGPKTKARYWSCKKW
jgi:hypothetical protein